MTAFGNLWRHQVELWSIVSGSGVAEEADAFLRGRLLQQMRRCGWHGSVPPWLWLNALAHGDRAMVVVISGYEPVFAAFQPGAPDEPSDVAWRRAQARIAAELLRRSGGSDAHLRALQLRVLVPLELAVDDGTTPERLVEVAVDELRAATA
jgi:hypothetical protein